MRRSDYVHTGTPPVFETPISMDPVAFGVQSSAAPFALEVVAFSSIAAKPRSLAVYSNLNPPRRNDLVERAQAVSCGMNMVSTPSAASTGWVEELQAQRPTSSTVKKGRRPCTSAFSSDASPAAASSAPAPRGWGATLSRILLHTPRRTLDASDGDSVITSQEDCARPDVYGLLRVS